jgi:hypothetical protein
MYTQNFIFINTEEEASAYIIPPNHTTLLMCRNKPIFFIKTADSLGQYTLDRYEFKKAPISPQTALPDNLITIEQFEAFKDEIRSLITSLSSPTPTNPQEVKPNASK